MDATDASSDEFGRTVEAVAEEVDSRVGMSDAFGSLVEARAYAREATIALAHGSASRPDRRVYRFRDWALSELLANAPGDLPATMYFSPGLRSLIELDERSSVDYLETLESYLAHSMNATATARALYLHRSSFLARLKRIEARVGEELADPERRLKLAICLRLLDASRQRGAGGDKAPTPRPECPSRTTWSRAARFEC